MSRLGINLRHVWVFLAVLAYAELVVLRRGDDVRRDVFAPLLGPISGPILRDSGFDGVSIAITAVIAVIQIALFAFSIWLFRFVSDGRRMLRYPAWGLYIIMCLMWCFSGLRSREFFE
ncbi:MAG: hypothetical protein AAFX06_32375 [Planctomycetota bacterium]